MTSDGQLEGLVEDLIARTERVSCADNRLSLPSSSNESPSLQPTLIGKILSPRNFYDTVVADILQKAWRPAKPFHIKKMDRNIFAFSFEHETDQSLAFNRRPWTFRGAHLVLKRWNPILTSQEIDFNSSTFWVQVHGLPAFWQRKDYINWIGGKVGTVVEVDFVGEPRIQWQRFVRIRVDIDLASPLSPGFFLPRDNHQDLWIGLKYERLPGICYWCGVIGHDTRDCVRDEKMLRNEFGLLFSAYGHWIRMENVESPPGIYARPPCNATEAILAPPHLTRDLD